MGIVFSAVASGLQQNISLDFVREEEERKVRWAGEAEQVSVQGGRDIPPLHREGPKQDWGSSSSQHSQTDNVIPETILETLNPDKI